MTGAKNFIINAGLKTFTLWFVVFFSFTTYAQTIVIRDCPSGRGIFEINEGVLQEYSTHRSILQLNGNIIRNYSNGAGLYEIDGSVLKDYIERTEILENDNGIIRNYQTGAGKYEIFNNKIRDFKSKLCLYEIEGEISSAELMMIIAAIEFID